MAGIRQLRQIQLGRETTAGTATTATTRWRGMGGLKDDSELVQPEEFIGVIGGGDRSYIPKLMASATFDDTDMTFEQLPHLLIAGVAATTAGVQDGTGSGYVYTYNIPHSTAPTIQTYTIRAGDDQQAEIMAYSFVQSLRLSVNAGEPWMMSADWVGRQVTTASFSTSVTIPTVETALGGSTNIILAPVDETYGYDAASYVAPDILSAEINFSNLIMPKWTLKGYRYFQFHYAGNREITGSITFEHDANGVAEREAFRNQTPRLLRFWTYGSLLTTAGTAYSNKSVYIDLPIKYTGFDALSDTDGNSIVQAQFRSRYNATVADAGKFIVVLDGTTSIP